MHSEPVRQGLNKALGELERMTASLCSTALQGGLLRFQGQARVLKSPLLLVLLTVQWAGVRDGRCIFRQQNP